MPIVKWYLNRKDVDLKELENIKQNSGLKYCINCGKALLDKANYCKYCGEKVKK